MPAESCKSRTACGRIEAVTLLECGLFQAVGVECKYLQQDMLSRRSFPCLCPDAPKIGITLLIKLWVGSIGKRKPLFTQSHPPASAHPLPPCSRWCPRLGAARPPRASGWPALDAAGWPPARTAAHGQDGWLGTDSLHGWSCSEDEFLQAYPHRWAVETNFFVAQDTTAMEMPRAWTAKALERRISLALLTGALLQAIAAATAPLAMGPWDRKPMPSAGRLQPLAGDGEQPPLLRRSGCSPRLKRSVRRQQRGRKTAPYTLTEDKTILQASGRCLAGNA